MLDQHNGLQDFVMVCTLGILHLPSENSFNCILLKQKKEQTQTHQSDHGPKPSATPCCCTLAGSGEPRADRTRRRT